MVGSIVSSFGCSLVLAVGLCGGEGVDAEVAALLCPFVVLLG